MIKKLNYLFITVLIASNVFSQATYHIYGTVSDSTFKPIEDGIVLLFKQKDSTLIKTQFVENGKFNIDVVDTGIYLLKTLCFGYNDETKAITIPNNEVIHFSLTQKYNSLKEVQITGYKQSYDFKGGNILANVENTVLATLPDAIEILSKLPTVQVSNDRESVSILGRGAPIIYLENQRITLSDLSLLSVNDIKSMEVINNPSSKYEAEGRAIILIKRKVNLSSGYKIEISDIAAQKRFFENRFAINGSFKKNKLELKCNFQYNYINRWEGLTGAIKTDTGTYQSAYDGTSIGPRTQYVLGAGIFYQLNKTDYVSLNVNARVQYEPFTSKTASTEKKLLAENSVDNQADGLSKRPFINASLNYLKDFSKIKSQLFLGGQLAHYERNLENEIANNINNTGFADTENRQQYSAINIAVARADFDKTFTKNAKWSTGLLLTQAKAITQFNINYLQTSSSIYTKYLYEESNQAAYTQLSGKINSIDYQIGVRMESTNLKGGYQDSSQLLLNRNFYNFFPKVSIALPLDSFSTIKLNYARSIRRPDYANANQVTNYITPFLEFSNNININPSLTDEIGINYQYKKVGVSLSLYQRADPSYHITKYDSLLNKLRIINENLSAEKGTVLTFSLPYEYKWFSSSNMLSAIYNKVDDNSANFAQAKPYLYVYSNNQFKLKKNYTLLISGWFNSKKYEGIFERNAQFAVDLSLSKIFFKKLTITLNAFDIFRSLNYIESYAVNNIYVKTTYYENVREFSIAVKYAFGKIQNQQYKNRDVNEGSRIN